MLPPMPLAAFRNAAAKARCCFALQARRPAVPRQTAHSPSRAGRCFAERLPSAAAATIIYAPPLMSPPPGRHKAARSQFPFFVRAVSTHAMEDVKPTWRHRFSRRIYHQHQTTPLGQARTFSSCAIEYQNIGQQRSPPLLLSATCQS